MAKIAVNIALGTIEIEGDEQFVLTAFGEVQAALKTINLKPQTVPKAEPEDAGAGHSPAADVAPKAKSNATKPSTPKKATQPSLNAHLDLAGIEDFVAKYNPAKNTERILVFAAFLRDRAEIYPTSQDDIYSCFHTMKSDMKIPVAFSKNMNDAKAAGFIEYEKLNEITITTMGENQLTGMSKKVAAE